MLYYIGLWQGITEKVTWFFIWCIFRRLDSNPLVCDCRLVWLAEMFQDNSASLQANATCRHPAHLRGRALSTINIADFNCSTYTELTDITNLSNHQLQTTQSSTGICHAISVGMATRMCVVLRLMVFHFDSNNQCCTLDWYLHNYVCSQNARTTKRNVL